MALILVVVVVITAVVIVIAVIIIVTVGLLASALILHSVGCRFDSSWGCHGYELFVDLALKTKIYI